MRRTSYPTDLTDAQWEILEPLLPPPKAGGRPRCVCLRQVVNAILYVVRSGGSWRLLPHEFGPWSTVYYYFWRWRQDGTLQKVHDALREQVREQAGRERSPSASCLDSQSVKTTSRGEAAATMAPSR